MSAWRPSILSEEQAPVHAVNCERCELSRQRRRVIWGEGNPNAPVFILLDNPGAREDREGNEFVCGTREALQAGLREVGIGLEQVYVTFLLKCRPIRAYDKPAAREACSPFLLSQLEEKKPRMLVALGNIVVQSLFPDEEADVKHYRGRWHTYQGISTVCSYHPLAIRRRPVLMKYLVEDLKLAAERLKNM
jgi:uracil-DNA glycosylase